MVLPIKNAENTDNPVDGEIYLFSFPPDCITSIYLGCKTREPVRQHVIDIIKRDSRYAHLKVYQVVMDERRFILNAELL